MTKQDFSRQRSGNAVLLSVIVPVHNEESNLTAFYHRLVRALTEVKALNLELVFINDGSRDQSLQQLLNLMAADPRVQIIDFSRNFGKEAALTAGLHFARGDAAVLMDADLQHPPELLPDLISAWRSGFDVVLAKRRQRGNESKIRRFLSEMFYRIHNRLSSPPLPENIGDFRLISRRVIEAVNRLPESSRFMKGILTWVGFDSTAVHYDQADRFKGVSNYNLGRLLNFAFDGILSFSTAPLRIWMYVGISVALASFTYVFLILIRAVILGLEVPGYASLMVAVGLIGGLNLIGIGVLGEYIGRTFLESKRRPLYIVKDHYAAGDLPQQKQSPSESRET